MCGGLGSRISEEIGSLPKVLMKIGEKTLIEHQIEQLSKFGVDRFLLLLGVGANQVIRYLSSKRIEFDFVIEEQPLGTGGSLISSLDLIDDEFFLIYGDILFNTNLDAMLIQMTNTSCDAIFLGRASEHIFDSDVVVASLDKRIKQIIRKPGIQNYSHRNIANCGIYLFRKKAFLDFSKENGKGVKLDLESEVLLWTLERGMQALVVKSNGYVRDLGTIERYKAGCEDYRLGKVSNDPKPTVILDRDGVLNRDVGHLSDTQNLSLFPGIGESVRRLNENGYRVIVITNQPVVARGAASEEFVDSVHAKIDVGLAKNNATIAEFYFCPHHPDRGFEGEIESLKLNCDCRKPRVGLYNKAQEEFPMILGKSFAVGDSLTDMYAAERFGIRFLGIGNKFVSENVPTFENLMEAVEFILLDRTQEE